MSGFELTTDEEKAIRRMWFYNWVKGFYRLDAKSKFHHAFFLSQDWFGATNLRRKEPWR